MYFSVTSIPKLGNDYSTSDVIIRIKIPEKNIEKIVICGKGNVLKKDSSWKTIYSEALDMASKLHKMTKSKQNMIYDNIKDKCTIEELIKIIGNEK